jgi:biotin carboxyl carrier protein
MTFEIEVGGRVRTVTVDPVGALPANGGRFRVRVDGVLHDVDTRVTDLGLSLIDAAGARTLDVAITERSGGEMWVQMPHVLVPVTIDARRYRRASDGPVASAGELRVLAPMPGRVLRVLVKPGDEVQLRQGLVVVEAMKMENEIAAPRAGTVKDVAVQAGQSVESGRLLVTLE